MSPPRGSAENSYEQPIRRMPSSEGLDSSSPRTSSTPQRASCSSSEVLLFTSHAEAPLHPPGHSATRHRAHRCLEPGNRLCLRRLSALRMSELGTPLRRLRGRSRSNHISPEAWAGLTVFHGLFLVETSLDLLSQHHHPPSTTLNLPGPDQQACLMKLCEQQPESWSHH